MSAPSLGEKAPQELDCKRDRRPHHQETWFPNSESFVDMAWSHRIEVILLLSASTGVPRPSATVSLSRGKRVGMPSRILRSQS